MIEDKDEFPVTTHPLTGELNNLNIALTGNRKQAERLDGMLKQIQLEIEENKQDREFIESKIDTIQKQIQNS